MHGRSASLQGAMACMALAIASAAYASEPQPAVSPVVTGSVTSDAAPVPLSTASIVRQQLTEPARLTPGREDRAALEAFYADAGETLLWTTPTGFTPRGIAAIAEIRKAADWGLQPSAYAPPEFPAGQATSEAIAKAEIQLGLAVLKYARHARSGRFDPTLLGRNFDQKPPVIDPIAVLKAVAATDAADAVLRGLHPRHPQFEALRQALLAARSAQDAGKIIVALPAPGTDVKLPAGPRLKPGQTHPQIALLRQRLAVPSEAGNEANYDSRLQQAVEAFQREQGLTPDGAINNATRDRLNGRAKPPSSASANVQRLIVNMERWRWLPEDLGAFYVWDNIPEYRMRVIKAGTTVHSETIIVGKPSTPTPVFSANMQYVIFHPTWGVPDGIKMNEIAPSLRNSSNFWGGSDPAILRRHNLRVSYNGRQIDPSAVDWASADIRSFQFTQPASASNVLGVVKFRFPNKHDVYMHDTPEKALFSRAEKAFSHGCMRVQNPRKLAEVLLAEDRGWSSAQVGNAIASGATQDVTLNKPTPVHVTYFTAMAEPDGSIKAFADLYGHDSRIASVLDGKSVQLVAQSDPAARPAREVRRPQTKTYAGGGASFGNFFSGLFGN